MSKKAKIILFSCLGALFIIPLFGFLFGALPYLLAGSELPEGAQLTLTVTDGGISASWPRSEQADSYRAVVFLPGEEEPLLSLECPGPECVFTGLPEGGGESEK